MSVQEFSTEYWKNQIEACATTKLRTMVSTLSEEVATKIKANDQSIVKIVKDILQTARTTKPNQSFSEIKLSIIEPTRDVLEGLLLIAEGFFDAGIQTTSPQVTEYREAFEEIQRSFVSEGVDRAKEKFKIVAKKILQKEIPSEPCAALELKLPEIDLLIRGWGIALSMVSDSFYEEEES